jgi:organic hydroperoxide reductase OsmC/OhrA
VTLRPIIKVTGAVDREHARRLHEQAHHLCFIANSVNFPVLCEPALEFE